MSLRPPPICVPRQLEQRVPVSRKCAGPDTGAGRCAVRQLFAQLGITNTYWAVLIPVAITPFGIYLAYVFARASVPLEMIEASRVDGSGELRTFRSIGLPLLVPGLVTIFLLQFIGAWNNFLLPYIMLDKPDLFPITVAMYLMLNRGGSEPVLYSLAIAGSAVAIVPVVAFVLILQRFWRLDLVSGSIK